MQFNLLAPSKWLRRSAWLLVLVVVAWGLGWLVGPALIRSQLERVASDQLGRKVSVGAVEFTPWTLELTIHDLAIATQDGTRAQFQFKRLYANAELESLLRLAPVVDTVTLDAPRLRLVHLGNGKYDVDDILVRFDKPAPAEPSNPPQFALFNLSLVQGAVEFEDRPVQKTHRLSDLALGIPFLSNLPARHHIKVEPRLAFSLNGSRFDSSAQTTPFAATRQTDASFELHNVDLAPYLVYQPSSLPVRLQKGVLAAKMRLDFEQNPTPRVHLHGEVEVRGLAATDAGGRDLLAWDALKVVLEDVRPLEQLVKVSLVELTAPRVDISRDAGGQLNLVPAGERAAVAPAAAPQAAPKVGWKADIAKLAVRDGVVHWSDAAVTPQARVAAQRVSLDVSGIRWPMEQAAVFQGSMVLADNAGQPAGTKVAGPSAATALTFSGAGTDREATVKASLTDLPLSLAAPYVAQYLNPALQGRVRSDVELSWRSPDLTVVLPSLVLSEMALVARGGPDGGGLPSVKQISVTQSTIDVAKRSAVIGKLVVDQPRITLARARDKRWMFEDWLKPVAVGPVNTQASAATVAKELGSAAAMQIPWSLVVSDLTLNGGEVGYRDDAMAKPVAFALSGVKVQVKDLRPDGVKPVVVQVSAGLRSGRAEPGQFDYRGNLQWQPLAAQGSVVATDIPVHVFEPYFAGGLNIEVLRADAGFKGEVRYAHGSGGPSVQVKGDAVVEDFRAHSLASGDGGLQADEELLNWKSLSLRGVDVALAPGHAARVAVTETTLGDFFARVIVYPDGRINLQNLVKSDAVGGAAPQSAASAPATAASRVAVAASPVPVTGLEPVITIGPVGLINGKVFFSDRFVKPNYSANLSELTGKLSAFSSVAPQGQPQLADLELRGRAEGTASLEILGKINPLATPLALDIKGIVRDLELPPLSPYSIKYAGHGIERGKLSVDVAYLVLPDGQLTATNKVVLNQLTFGDKVEGAPASLPVKLAVALLSDRNGVIDINLPISGSLNDPQFSLGPIIFKVIVNLIVKAITAPFSLLASAFGGGGDELSTVVFAPGSAALVPQAKVGLDKVARALADRPALKMTVIGTASLDVEREAYKRERLRALLVSEKRRSLLAGAAPAADAGAALTVSDAEIPALLKEVYRRADITKPRDLAGLAKDLPAPEMEALLLANIPVTEDAMRELAVQRGVAVKDYLGAQQLPVERLFLGAVKPVVDDPKWTPRAELSLAN